MLKFQKPILLLQRNRELIYVFVFFSEKNQLNNIFFAKNEVGNWLIVRHKNDFFVIKKTYKENLF